MSDEEKKTWLMAYPCYFDSEKTVAEGRRCPKDLCMPNPNINLISIAIGQLGFNPKIDLVSKHPRDYFSTGRVRFQIKKVDGSLVKEGINNKKQLFAAICAQWSEAQERYDLALESQKKKVEEKKLEIKAAQEAAGFKSPEAEAEAKDNASKKDKKKKKKK